MAGAGRGDGKLTAQRLGALRHQRQLGGLAGGAQGPASARLAVHQQPVAAARRRHAERRRQALGAETLQIVAVCAVFVASRHEQCVLDGLVAVRRDGEHLEQQLAFGAPREQRRVLGVVTTDPGQLAIPGGSGLGLHQLAAEPPRLTRQGAQRLQPDRRGPRRGRDPDHGLIVPRALVLDATPDAELGPAVVQGGAYVV